MAEVSLPVRLQPNAAIGEISTECCGEPVVTVRQFCGSRCGCEIVITQTVCVSIPVEYGAEAQAGDPGVICRKSGCRVCLSCASAGRLSGGGYLPRTIIL